MKFSCTKENLVHALSLASSLTGKNVNLPILNNILLKADAQKVEVVGTNLDVAITVTVRAKVEAPGSFTVPARTLLDFVNLLSEEKVDVELEENELAISAGKSFTKIKGVPADEYPVVPSLEDGKGIVMKAEDLKRALGQVLPAVAKNDIRPELAGVFFSCNAQKEKEVVLAATDSYRLAEKRLELLQGTEMIKTVIPGRTAAEMVHILAATTSMDEEQNARLLLTDNQIALHFNTIQMTSRLIEGVYPDYTQIIPTDFPFGTKQ
jgi:DNA polymerase-3 subunit beta